MIEASKADLPINELLIIMEKFSGWVDSRVEALPKGQQQGGSFFNKGNSRGGPPGGFITMGADEALFEMQQHLVMYGCSFEHLVHVGGQQLQALTVCILRFAKCIL